MTAKIVQKIPDTVFHTRVRDASIVGDNPFRWQDRTSGEIFGGRNTIVFGVPAAFSPACSEDHLPGYDVAYEEFCALGVDAVICISVNDAFVMFQWARSHNVSKVDMLPDGNGDFTRGLGMLVDRFGFGMGSRSWRYAAHVVDHEVRALFPEPGFPETPRQPEVTVSGALAMLEYLRSVR